MAISQAVCNSFAVERGLYSTADVFFSGGSRQFFFSTLFNAKNKWTEAKAIGGLVKKDRFSPFAPSGRHQSRTAAEGPKGPEQRLSFRESKPHLI